MPGPSDIRVNPFNNATNYVNLTERHIVPSVSPFVVRLNEVPEKQDPSNMQMFYVDDTTGQTTETALTEVAATPGAGEFRPDYSTNAFDDTSWNTGLIEFSSADAGKIIEVSYTATGTLAGVKTNRYPAWWLDRGDGSDGAFNPSGNITISGEKNYTSVFIPAGVTVSISGYARIKCQGSFINKGTINADGQGCSGGMNGSTGGNGGSGRGAAGNGCYVNNAQVPLESIDGYITLIAQGCAFGAGGSNNSAAGGKGGGAVCIVASELNNLGTIRANGAQGAHDNNTDYNVGGMGGGGGAGGCILLIAKRVLNNGTLTVSGGRGGGSSTGHPSTGGTGGNGYYRVIEIGE